MSAAHVFGESESYVVQRSTPKRYLLIFPKSENELTNYRKFSNPWRYKDFGIYVGNWNETTKAYIFKNSTKLFFPNLSRPRCESRTEGEWIIILYYHRINNLISYDGPEGSLALFCNFSLKHFPTTILFHSSLPWVYSNTSLPRFYSNTSWEEISSAILLKHFSSTIFWARQILCLDYFFHSWCMEPIQKVVMEA